MSLISEALSRWMPMRERVSAGADITYNASSKSGASGRLPAGESEAPNQKGTAVGPLIAYHTLGEPVWAPRDYAAFARAGFMQNAIVYGGDAERPPAYSRDWAEASGQEAMLAAACRHLRSVPQASAAHGDVIIFRLRPGAVAKHAAIMTGPAAMVHAVEGAPVAEVPLTSWWRRRIAGTFQFPGIIEGD